jgi:hypothetical protein
MHIFLSKKSGLLAGLGRQAGTLLAISLAAMTVLGATSFVSSPASASTAKVVVQSGGMVRAGSQVRSSSSPAANPSCHSITYRGNAGYISVQESNNRLQWGITMTPLSYSIGTWNVSTYLSGKKTSSGFNRTVATPYIPAPSGGVSRARCGKLHPIPSR